MHHKGTGNYSGGWAHIISNMLFLGVFGDNIEAVLGRIAYLGFYLAGGLVASAAHILFNLGAEVPSLGASGAVAPYWEPMWSCFPNRR